jgi:hypothetical protein
MAGFVLFRRWLGFVHADNGIAKGKVNHDLAELVQRNKSPQLKMVFGRNARRPPTSVWAAKRTALSLSHHTTGPQRSIRRKP